MNSHRDSFTDGEIIEPTEIRVVEARGPYRGKQSWHLTVEDIFGQQFVVKVWRKHDWNTWWRSGWRYIVKGGRVHQRGGKSDVVVSSTDEFTARRPDDVVTFLAMSDSHIGRECRAEDIGLPHRTVRRLLTALGYARRYSVDAVLHGGDLLDDDQRPVDIELLRDGFDILDRNGIPFYHILGNHGEVATEEILQGQSGVDITHLDQAGVQVGDFVEVFGVDHCSKTELDISPAGFCQSGTVSKHLLLLHHDLSVREKGDVPMTAFLDPPDAAFDAVLSGHLHAPERHEWRGIPVQYLGSTAGIARAESVEDASAWLVRVTRDMVDIEQLSLR